MELPNIVSLLGAVLLIAGTTLVGRVYGKQFQERVEFLRDVQQRLEVLKNEIAFFKGVLTDSFQRAASAKGPAQELFSMMLEQLEMEEGTDVQKAWEYACQSTCKEIYLTQEDGQVICSFGQLLGTSDVEGQIANLEVLEGQLQQLERKAEEARKKNQPLWQKIGPIVGIAIAIFLL